jgi:tape measure domain-containing protein
VADLANLRISVDSREVKSAISDLNQLSGASSGAEQGATKASSAFRGLGAVLASLGIAAIAREAIMLADTFTRMSGQLALVTRNAEQLAAAEKQLFAMSQTTRVGYESTVSLFSRLARSTENLGVSQQSVMRVTETINKAMIVSGTSAEQASGALMQLGQAFASGALRGDELNSVMEGMPRVAQAIAEGMGITVGELRKLGAQGKLTGAEVYAALLKMGNDIDSEFKRMPMTVSQSMTVLSNSLMLFVAEADRATGFTAALASGIVSLSNNLNQIARVAQVVIVSVAGMAAAFVALRAALAAQAIAAYIAQLVAMQFALGATTTASALAGAGIKGLQAILASTGWGLAVVAIGAVIGAIYALTTAQSEARGETQNLINDLNRLAATKDKSYGEAAKRGVEGLKEVQRERNQLMERNKLIEQYTAKSGMVGKVAIEYKRNADSIKAANAFLIQNGNAIIASYKTYTQVEPAIQNVSAAIEKTGKKAKEATDPLDKYRDALTNLQLEGLKIGMNPQELKSFEVEQIALEAASKGYDDYAKKIREAGAANAEKQAQYDAKEIADGYKLEAEAIGKTAIELKQLEINQNAATAAAGPFRDAIIANGAVLVASMKAVEDKKKSDEDAKKAADEYKQALEAFNGLKVDINFEAIFGNMGKAMGGVLNAFDQIADRQKKYNALTKLGFKDEATRVAAQQRNARLEINSYGNLAASAKGFFKEKSVGYKVMQAAETAFRAFEFAMSLKAMAMNTAEAASTVATEATKTAAQTASGASKMFSQLGVYAFPIVAAMIGVMASLGGKSGSVATPSIPDAEAMQAAQGAGSVLGDSTSKSDSINRAFEIMASNSNRDLEYSNQMVQSLRSIQSNMANLSNNVAKQISVSGGMFDTSAQRLGKTGSSGVLGLFGSSTTRELHDLGIDIAATSIAEIIAGGISGSTYQVVQQVKKKSGFLGIGGGTKTSYQTTSGSIDQDVRNSITGVVASLRQGLIDGADVIGLQGAQAILDAFQVNIGKISLMGLSGQEIEEQLNAIFSKVGDQMAGALLPSLMSMQQIGEGLFETFARVAREYQVVDVALRSIGKEFGAVGIASIEARNALVGMFESLDQFVEQTNFFRDNFLTEAEQIAPVTQAVTDELKRLGLASITTIEQFKNTVLALDLTSDAGQETYAALLQLAPAFKMVADYQKELTELSTDSAKALSKFTDEMEAVKKQQESAINTLRGAIARLAKEAADAEQNLRKVYDAEMSKLDGIIGLRSAAVTAVQQAYEREAGVFRDAANNFRALGASIRSFASGIFRELVGPSSNLEQARQGFINLVDAARGGSRSALEAIPSAGAQLTDVIAATATSRTDMLRQLLAVNALTQEAALYADAQASIAELQLEKLEKQFDVLTELLGVSREAAASNVTFANAVTALLSADKAASIAEVQKQLITQQIGSIINLTTSTETLAEAISKVDDARSNLTAVREAIDAAGLSQYIEEIKKTGIREAAEAIVGLEQALEAELNLRASAAPEIVAAYDKAQAAIKEVQEATEKRIAAYDEQMTKRAGELQQTYRELREAEAAKMAEAIANVTDSADAKIATVTDAFAKIAALYDLKIAEVRLQTEISANAMRDAANRLFSASELLSAPKDAEPLNLDPLMMAANDNAIGIINALSPLEIELRSVREAIAALAAAPQPPAPVVNVGGTVVNIGDTVVNVPETTVNVSGPVVNVGSPVVNVPETTVNVAGPTVNVGSPIVNVPETTVNVPAPVVNVPQTTVNVPAPVVNVAKTEVNVNPTPVSLNQTITNENNTTVDVSPSTINVGGATVNIAPPIVNVAAPVVNLSIAAPIINVPVTINNAISTVVTATKDAIQATTTADSTASVAAANSTNANVTAASTAATNTVDPAISQISESSTVKADLLAQPTITYSKSSSSSMQDFGVSAHTDQYAMGGMHDGGWRLVGENGPELEYTGPSRIYNNGQTSEMLNNGELVAEVKYLREELRNAMFQVAKNTGKSYDMLNRWNGNGLPETRDVAA